MQIKDMLTFQKASDRVLTLRQKVLGAPQVCTERARLMTESYKATEGEPTVIRRAKAMYHIMENMSIRIEDGELIVGNSTSKNRGAPLMPELQWKWYLEEIDLVSTRQWDRCAPIAEEDKKIMAEVLPYWEGKTPEEEWLRNMTPVQAKNQQTGAFLSMAGTAMHLAHTAIDYEKALKLGLNGMKKEIEDAIAKTDPADEAKLNNFKASIISLDAVILFASRFAALAEQQAAGCTSSIRKKELEQIAVNCRRVPAESPESFQQALQAMWFIHIGLRIEAPALGITFGRPDQFLYPYYKADIDNGVIDDAQAIELISLTLVKMNDMAMLMSSACVETLGGFPTMAGITLGGLTLDGECAVNDLSYLILESETQVGLTVDEPVIRIAENTPLEFIERACAANKVLRGKLKFASDYTVLRQAKRAGRPVEFGRDYVIAGCFTPAVVAKCVDTTAVTINSSLLLEMALNNGVSRVTGEVWGEKTGDPREFKTFDEVIDAFKKQITAVVEPGYQSHNAYRALYTQYCPQPYQSLFFEGYTDKGLDLWNGLTAPYGREGYGLVGLVDTADALAGLKKAVFDDKVCTMPEMIDALDKDFVGYEELQQYLKNAPKYGNDDAYVDSLANLVVDIFYDELAKYKGYAGDDLGLASSTGTSHLQAGQTVGATSDGRNAGLPLAEGGVSPHQGRNQSGITGTFNSVSTLDHSKIPAGSVFNMRVSPSALRDEPRLARFANMLKIYCKRGGFHAQFNIIDSETLREAQREPEKYKDLVVRVATYSALFTELSTSLQNDIIERSVFDEL